MRIGHLSYEPAAATLAKAAAVIGDCREEAHDEARQADAEGRDDAEGQEEARGQADAESDGKAVVKKIGAKNKPVKAPRQGKPPGDTGINKPIRPDKPGK